MAEKTLEEQVRRLNDIHEIQNVMSLHEYYHTAGMHKEEVEEIWAQKTPGVSWETGDLGRFEGIDAIRKIYVDYPLQESQSFNRIVSGAVINQRKVKSHIPSKG